MTALGSIVTSDRLHGKFGYAGAVRNEAGRPTEFRIETLHGHSWIAASQVRTVTFAEVQKWYDDLLREQRRQLDAVSALVGKKVPKYDPREHLSGLAPYLSDAYRHEDGSITYIIGDPEPGDTESPRTHDGNVSTLIQTNDRFIDIDEDVAGLAEARNRWYGGWGYGDFSCDQTAMMTRYLAMFRPDIAHYDPHWSAGDSSGWGYVTREAWDRWMGADYDGDVTPKQAFDQEVKVYGLWANSEVYISAHIAKRGGKVEFCHGHLGYDDHKDIAKQYTNSPILEVLA